MQHFFQRLNKTANNVGLIKLVSAILTAALAAALVQNYRLDSENKQIARKLTTYTKEINFLQREAGGFTFFEASSYVQVNSPLVQQVAEKLGTPDKIYEFMISDIDYFGSTYEDNIYAENVLQTKNSNCLGQANLLCAMLRYLGFTPKHCHITYGNVVKDGIDGSHAWVELNYNGKWLVLDPTGFTGERRFGFWNKENFYKTWKVLPVFEYNDTSGRFIPY